MKSTSLIATLLFLLPSAAPSLAGPDNAAPGPLGMGPPAVAELLGPDLMAACHGDFASLELPAETQRLLEDRRFELRRKGIRTVGEIQVLRLELGRLVAARGFDPSVAQAKANELSGKEAEFRALHLEFLSALGAELTDAQWKKLWEGPRGPVMPGMGGMMPMMGGPAMVPGGPHGHAVPPQ